jgi:outer membrane immunogenic protein
LNQSFRVKQKQHQQTRGCAVPVRKYLPSAIATAIASMLAVPAFAADQALPELPPLTQSAAPSDAFGDNADPLTGALSPAAVHHTGWQGFYLGGEFDYTYGSADFSKGTQGPVSYSLRNTTVEQNDDPSQLQVLGTGDHAVPGFGGFVGYNFEYLTPSAKVVMGFEADYEQASLSLYAPSSPIARVYPDGYAVTITGNGQMTDLNFGTLRARAGWALGNFLPYAFAGLALGRANINISETTTLVQPSPSATFIFPGTNGTNGEWLYGLTAGVGLDVALTPNIFLRAEYEYVQFQQVAGTVIELNTARLGAGFKF